MRTTPAGRSSSLLSKQRRWGERGAERRGEEGSARTNQKSWTYAAWTTWSTIVLLWTRLQTSLRRGEFVSFLARGSPEAPPHATITPNSILTQRPPLFTCVCGRFRLPGYVARMAGPRTFYLTSIIAPPRRSEPTQPQKELKRYRDPARPQSSSIRPRRSLI